MTLQDVPIREAAPPPRKRSRWNIELTKGKVKRKDLMHFSRQLAVFMRAGIPILDALDTIRSEVRDKTFGAVLDDVIAQLRSGSTFADAAASRPEAFPPYYLGILSSAELTGRLDEVLLQLADYIERDLDARSKISNALTYPAVIMVMSVVVVIVLVAFVLPRFVTFFDSLDAELPLATRLLLGTTGFLASAGPLLLALLLLAGLGILLAVRTDRGRHLKDRILLRVPALGPLLRHVVLERFCRIMASMMSAGVPLPQALAVAAKATSNTVYAAGLVEAREKMMRGEGLAGPLAETGLFPASARQMFRVGEATGTLDDQLEGAADYFARELDDRIKRFTGLFEPAVLVVVGLLVGFVAVALVSAMYGIFGSAETI